MKNVLFFLGIVTGLFSCNGISEREVQNQKPLTAQRKFDEKDRLFLNFYCGMNPIEFTKELNSNLKNGILFKRIIKFKKPLKNNENGELVEIDGPLLEEDAVVEQKKTIDTLQLSKTSGIFFECFFDTLKLAYEFTSNNGFYSHHEFTASGKLKIVENNFFYTGFRPKFLDGKLVSITLYYPIYFNRHYTDLAQVTKNELIEIFKKKYGKPKKNQSDTKTVFIFEDEYKMITISNHECTYENINSHNKIIEQNKRNEILKKRELIEKQKSTLKDI